MRNNVDTLKYYDVVNFVKGRRFLGVLLLAGTRGLVR